MSYASSCSCGPYGARHSPASSVRRVRPSSEGAEGGAGGSQYVCCQQLLVRGLWSDAPSGVLSCWLSGVPPPTRPIIGLCSNVGVTPQRSLTSAFPTH